MNEKALINAHNFPTTAALIDYIKHIDNDNAAALAILREPLFLDSNHKAIFQAHLEAFLLNIFSQDYEVSFRRGRSCLRAFEEARYKRYTKILGIFKWGKRILSKLRR